MKALRIGRRPLGPATVNMVVVYGGGTWLSIPFELTVLSSAEGSLRACATGTSTRAPNRAGRGAREESRRIAFVKIR